MVIGPAQYEREVQKRLVVEPSEEAQKQLLVNYEKCEIDFLRKYSRSDLLAARALIAQNPGVDEDILTDLSRDSSWELRGVVAASKYTPRRLLLELLLDEDSHVRYCLASNGNLTHDEIRLLFLSYKQSDPPLGAFARNPNLPDDLRELIRKSDDESAKEWLRITEERSSGDNVGEIPEPKSL